jgi:hypothetical protein
MAGKRKAAVTTPKDPNIQEVEKKEKKGKEKKKIQVVAVVTPNGIEGTFSPEPRKPLICKLPFEASEVKFSDMPLQYDPNPPVQEVLPYADPEESYFEVKTGEKEVQGDHMFAYSDAWTMNQEHIKTEEKAEKQESKGVSKRPVHLDGGSDAPVATWKSIGENFHRCDLFSCYKKGEAFELPSSTPIACFWCAHTFEDAPCFLPMREEKGAYHIYGNFCTPQCALSYLLKETLDPHVRWERMALLHRMYRPRSGGRLFPAPPRESLAWFGGPYSYDEFRTIIGENKTRVDIQMPPMVSILGSLDTKPIDFYDSSLQNTFTQGLLGIAERFAKPSEGGLRLKRSKPLKDRDNTLDACIQISFKAQKVEAAF